MNIFYGYKIVPKISYIFKFRDNDKYGIYNDNSDIYLAPPLLPGRPEKECG